jgi:geranylgeranyl diphosphate synthase type II
MMDFQKAYHEKAQLINQGLEQLLKQRKDCPASIVQAMEYSLMAGGKRLRPILFLSAYELACSNSGAKADLKAVLPMACALEMIHTYSLIHDDLPAMDNDDYRRGKPTSHKVFGEAAAILAGDGLLNLAYEIMLEHAPSDAAKIPGYLKAMSVIAYSAGISGMIGGQVVDLESENKESSRIDDNVLTYIHTHKTEALITGALKAGVLVHNGETRIIDAVVSYGKAFGIAFQITDDLLDVVGDLNHLGKQPGSDEKKGKLTWPARYGIEASEQAARQYIEQAISSLEIFGAEGEFLRHLAVSMRDRNQ